MWSLVHRLEQGDHQPSPSRAASRAYSARCYSGIKNSHCRVSEASKHLNAAKQGTRSLKKSLFASQPGMKRWSIIAKCLTSEEQEVHTINIATPWLELAWGFMGTLSAIQQALAVLHTPEARFTLKPCQCSETSGETTIHLRHSQQTFRIHGDPTTSSRISLQRASASGIGNLSTGLNCVPTRRSVQSAPPSSPLHQHREIQAADHTPGYHTPKAAKLLRKHH